MDLSQFLEKFPGAHLARADDNAKLLHFFERSSMQGDDLRLRYMRGPDFFAFLRLQSPQHFVFFTEEHGEVSALGTVIIRPGYLNGRETIVGYLGDLRIRPSMAMSRLWRKFYSALVEHAHEIREFQGCKYFLTAIIDENLMARRALVERKSRRPAAFSYDPVCGYEMVNLLHRWPLPKTRVPRGWAVETLGSETLAEFLDFYDSEQKKIPFGYRLHRKDFEQRLATWPGLDIEKFFLVRRQGRIVASTGVYSPSAVKKIVVERYPASLRMVRRFVSLPRPGQELSFDYLTHLQLASDVEHGVGARAFQLLLERAWYTRQSRLLAFARLQPLKAEMPTAGFVAQRVPMTLYSVRNVADPALTQKQPPGFEMALV